MRDCLPSVSEATARCPFLKAVVDLQIDDKKLNRLAVNSLDASTTNKSKPIFPEEAFASAFDLFHGNNGVIPLSTVDIAPKCPFNHAKEPTSSQHVSHELKQTPLVAATPLPMASISLSGFKFLPNPGDFFNNRPQTIKKNKPRRTNNNNPNPSNTNNKPSSLSNNSSTSTTTTTSSKPSSPPNKSSSPGSNTSTRNPTTTTTTTHNNTTNPTIPNNNNNNNKNNNNNTPNSNNTPHNTINNNTSSGGRCPMRKVFGPFTGLLPLAINGRLECPRAIVSMRAFIAGLEPVRQLRPQALPVRSLAMASTAIAANVPCGMWREHTKKFSPEWFVAVHATIPFVAMLRKAVLMPKWAILLTIAGAIAGQGVGARVERKRLTMMAMRSGGGGGGNSNDGWMNRSRRSEVVC